MKNIGKEIPNINPNFKLFIRFIFYDLKYLSQQIWLEQQYRDNRTTFLNCEHNL